MLNLNSLIIFSDKPRELAQFYKKVLEKDIDMEEGDYFGFLAGNTFLSIGPHEKIKGKNPNPERILFNFETKDVKGEFERIKSLGVKIIAKPYQMGDETSAWIATFADPDGNYFQLMTPWEDDKSNQ